MRIKSVVSALLLALMGWMMIPALANAAGPNESDPVALLKYVADNMIANLHDNKANLKNKPQTVYKLAYQYVVPYADLAEMSKRVLSPSVWRAATPEQRMQFQKEFTTTVIRTYASALMAYQDQTVKFYPVRGDVSQAKTLVVNSEIISSQSQPVHVTYRLMRKGSVWRLYDMSVEGVNMLESFRAQFADMLSRGNLDGLLKQISGHNDRK